ncbi:MAG: hypothetical protein LKF43_00260 [Streptococcaceae bacterium]|jgi:hypothetical protein|nr:hypothetical protein [Streptococcaceae bacterium]
MKSYPEIYILGRMVDGVYVEYGNDLYRSFVRAEFEAFRRNNKRGFKLVSQAKILGTWKVLDYGRPRTVGE